MLAQNDFLAQAKIGNNQPWRYIVGMILVLLALGIFSIPQVLVTDIKSGRPTVASHWYLLVAIGSFAGGILTLWVWLKNSHHREFQTLITPQSSVNWKRVVSSAAVWLVCTAIVELGMYSFFPEMYRFSWNLQQWLPAFIVGFLFLPIQTSCEELIFRGYLFQAIGSRNVVVGLVISSVLFGLMHSFNPETAKVGFALAMSYYIGVGLFFALLTYFDGKLELALGIHASNNIYAFLLVTYPDSALPSPSVITMTELNFPLMIVGWLLAVVLYTVTIKWVFKWI